MWKKDLSKTLYNFILIRSTLYGNFIINSLFFPPLYCVKSIEMLKIFVFKEAKVSVYCAKIFAPILTKSNILITYIVAEHPIECFLLLSVRKSRLLRLGRLNFRKKLHSGDTPSMISRVNPLRIALFSRWLPATCYFILPQSQQCEAKRSWTFMRLTKNFFAKKHVAMVILAQSHTIWAISNVIHFTNCCIPLKSIERQPLYEQF